MPILIGFCIDVSVGGIDAGNIVANPVPSRLIDPTPTESTARNLTCNVSVADTVTLIGLVVLAGVRVIQDNPELTEYW